MKQNQDMILKKAAQKFGGTISYWLKRLGYSLKKRLFALRSKPRKAKSVSRIDQRYSVPNLVYIDKNGIDRLCAKTKTGAEKVKSWLAKRVGSKNKYYCRFG
ncbi:transposase [Holospora undulata]|uniref:Uncharacterized protein n=1 Tax=Holospora undulata HU1 TaxID=1321371 RepID=A0A061JFX3_9PROT|nr:transposase [Holospora undulata]ETZ04620.1 hypothetical protein K737_300971 [Holospora undulata HU1]